MKRDGSKTTIGERILNYERNTNLFVRETVAKFIRTLNLITKIK